MLAENEELFAEFTQIHSKYVEDRAANQDQYNFVGAKVLDVAKKYEDMLCGKTERGNNSVFSSKLADKFKAEIKAFYPMYDFIGVEITTPSFDIPRIEI